MRLYEFTNSTKYLLPKANAADLVKPSNKTADTTDIADRHLKKKPSIKNSMDAP
jgi:hypothetical protein